LPSVKYRVDRKRFDVAMPCVAAPGDTKKNTLIYLETAREGGGVAGPKNSVANESKRFLFESTHYKQMKTLLN